MSISLALSVPFVERKVVGLDEKTTITLGIKCYDSQEISEIKKQYFSIADNSETLWLQNKINALVADITIDSEEFNLELNNLKTRLLELEELQDQNFYDFYKSHIVFVKDLKLSEPIGLIKDTRLVQPVDDAWDSPEECLDIVSHLLLTKVAFLAAVKEAIRDAIFQVNRQKKVKI